MRLKLTLAISLTLTLFQCQKPQPAEPANLHEIMQGVEGIEGKPAYLASPCVTSGDRLYVVGHQDGTFPDLGWHVTGEMGGIWDHPVKLMDGFAAALRTDGQAHCLDLADRFVKYPFASSHFYEKTPVGVSVERFQFVPDGEEAVVVEFVFKNETPEPQSFTFDFNGMTDLRPVWLGERTGMEDGGDFVRFDEATGSLIGKDSLNDWFVVWGSAQAPSAHEIGSRTCDFERAGKGANASLSYPVSVTAGGAATLPIVIAGSYQSQAAAQSTLQRVQANAGDLLRSKKERYAGIAATARLTVPDKNIQQAFEWVKYNTDWLIRDVPGQGRGISAGTPDYPWWFGCDSEYALPGVLATGRSDIVFSTIELLKKLSDETNGNGRIIHEASTNGSVFNPGNINETPQFASLVWTTYEWTGDRAFLKKYYPLVKQGLDWLLKENDADGNLLPDGFGMMEIHGLDSEMIDVAAYTCQAFADAANMADEMGETEKADEYRQVAGQLRQRINSEFWVPEFNSYADFIGTTRQALHLIDDAIVRADTLGKPWAVEELRATKARISKLPLDKKQGFVLYHNWVVNTPMETGIADPEKAVAALETGSRFVNPFGMFVTGIDRDETAGQDEGSFAAKKKIFSYVGAVMTLPTGVQAIAENNYGRPDEALDYLQRMVRSFSYAMPGSMYEVSPDFGMMAQAWNVYALAVPVVTQFFGIQPEAQKQVVNVRPLMPSTWDDASLENLTIGDNSLTMKYLRQGGGVKIDLTQSKTDWKIRVAFPEGKYKKWTVNGKEVTPAKTGREEVIEFAGGTNVVTVE